MRSQWADVRLRQRQRMGSDRDCAIFWGSTQGNVNGSHKRPDRPVLVWRSPETLQESLVHENQQMVPRPGGGGAKILVTLCQQYVAENHSQLLTQVSHLPHPDSRASLILPSGSDLPSGKVTGLLSWRYTWGTGGYRRKLSLMHMVR